MPTDLERFKHKRNLARAALAVICLVALGVLLWLR